MYTRVQRVTGARSKKCGEISENSDDALLLDDRKDAFTDGNASVFQADT